MRDWAVLLETKPKYVVSTTRTDFPWTESHLLTGDLCARVQALKDATPAGVLLGSCTLAAALDRLDLIDEYLFLVHPRIAGHGPTLHQSGLPSTRQLALLGVTPLANGAVAMRYRRVLRSGASPGGDERVPRSGASPGGDERVPRSGASPGGDEHVP